MKKSHQEKCEEVSNLNVKLNTHREEMELMKNESMTKDATSEVSRLTDASNKKEERKTPEVEAEFEAEVKSEINAMKSELKEAREITKQATSRNGVLEEKNWILKG